MLFVGAAGPFLDRTDANAGAVVESSHDPESCAPGHDHRLCLQVGANQALPSPEGVRPTLSPVRIRVLPPSPSAGTTSVLADGHPARGPPSA